MTDDAAIEFTGVHKWYGSFHVLRNINLAVGRGERIVVCGPSGSGKSTLIRCVNALEEHQRGVIRVDGIELTADKKTRRNFAESANVGMRCRNHCFRNDFVMRAVRDTMVFAPPLVFTEEHVEAFVDRAALAIDLTYQEVQEAGLK